MLSDRQKRALDSAIPGIGANRAEGAGELINKLFVEGPDNAALALGTAATGTTAGKLNAVYVTYTSNAVANTADSVAHGLGRTPVGYVVVRNGNGGTVFDGGAGFTSSTISLKCTTASNAVTLLVF